MNQFNGKPMLPGQWTTLLKQNNKVFHDYLSRGIYARDGTGYLETQKARFIQTVNAHKRKYGDSKCFLARAPGRLNGFLEYLDMCAGDHMSTTIDGDIPMAFCPRADDKVTIHNTSPLFPDRSFSISESFSYFKSASWGQRDSEGLEDNWENRTRVYPYYGGRKGDHMNYCLAPFLRFAWEYGEKSLRGANITFGPSTVPLRAGMSSSSAIVVLSAIACIGSNPHLLSGTGKAKLCSLLGEAEWYVGTHGGANDHTTILCGQPDSILYNRYSGQRIGTSVLPFLKGLRIVVANSLWEANKSLGAKYVFNLRKGWMDIGNHLLVKIISRLAAYQGPKTKGWALEETKRNFQWKLEAESLPLLDELPWPEIQKRYHLFGSLDTTVLNIPQQAIAEMLQLLPEGISPEEAKAVFGKRRSELARDYTLPDDKDRVWRPRNAASFFNKENVLGREIEKCLLEADKSLKEGVDPGSSEYRSYRVRLGELIEEVQETIRDDFMVSNDQLELLLRIARNGPGYMGGKLTGAGSGGAVCIFVEREKAADMADYLDSAYYGVNSHFDAYRETIARLPDRKVREELEANLEGALSDPSAQRRIVSFSCGAGTLCAPDRPAG